MRRQDNSEPSTAGTSTAETAAAADPGMEGKRSAGPREGLVLLCIAIVAAAIATMLFTQLGLSLRTSALAGAGAWAVLMLIHKQVQKSAQIRHLKVELARARMQGGGKPKPASLRAPPMPSIENARPSGNDVRRPELIGVPIASEVSRPDISRPDVSRPAGGRPIASEPRMPAGSVPSPRPTPAGAEVAPAASSGDRAGGVPLRGAMLPTKTTANNAAPAPDRAAGSGDLTGMRMPPTARAPLLAAGPGEAAAATPQADVTLINQAGEQPADKPGMIRDHWSFRPRSDGQELPVGVPAGASVRPAMTIEGDLELVQRKIRELADEVNSAEASRPPIKPLRADIRSGPTNDALEHSIGALKSAASSMRGRPQAGEFMPTLWMLAAGATRAAEPPPSPTLPDLVIPATAQSIAGSDKGARTSVAPPHLDLPVSGLPSMDFPSEPSLGQAHDASPIAASSLSLGPSLSMPAGPALSPRVVAITRAIDDDAMEVFLAPIVTLSEHSVRHYEMTVGLKSAEGATLEIREDDFPIAGRELDAQFDVARLNRAAELTLRMEKREKDGSLLATFFGSSFTNRAFLESLAHAYEARQRLSAQLVVGLSQRSVEALSLPAWQAVRDMHAFGFRFALDKVEHMGTDFAALAAAGFKFVRLDAQALFDGVAARDRFVSADEIYQRATLAGLTIIAGGIESAKVQKRLLEAGIALGQGSLFGAARQVMVGGAGRHNRPAAA